MAEDLFGAALQERLRRQAPLAARLRPATLDDVVGQEHLLGTNGPLRRLIEADRMSSVILWGPPGTGKTTLARLIAGATERAFETLSAVTAGVKDVRDVVARARTRLAEQGQGTILFLDSLLTSQAYASYDPGPVEHCGIHHFRPCVRHTRSVDDLRVQLVSHSDGRRSWVVLNVAAGSVHGRAERFLAPLGEGTQRTYAYHLVDHLRWLVATGHVEDTVTMEDLRRYMALCGTEQPGPLGVPWRDRPLSEAARGVRAACLKGYYLDVATREAVNETLLAAFSERRRANGRDRDRSVLGHLTTSVVSNPLASGDSPRRHPRMLPDGTRTAMLGAVRTARDRMIVTWLADSGMRIGELCGLSFCDLHLRRHHPCGERQGPHVHVVKRANPNHASAKTGAPAKIIDGVVTGGTIRRASPAMVDTYHEYLAEDYHRVRALAQTDLVLVHVAGPTAGQPLGTHGARQMIERAGRRAGLGLVKPHAFRHTWATALTEATGGNTKAVADEGGWSSPRTVEETYAHLAGDPALETALSKVWGESP